MNKQHDHTVIPLSTLKDTDINLIYPLDRLHSWAENGWLRRLDSAMAEFMRELDPDCSPALLVSTAILAQMEGRGHTCLSIRRLVEQPDALLNWPQLANTEITALWTSLPATLSDWLTSLQSSALVRTIQLDQEPPDRGQPLVLSGSHEAPLLYLRRYYLHERQVSGDVLQRTAASHPVDEIAARHWLDCLFDKPASDTCVDWQKLACAVALRASLTIITGGPGTGKTYTAARMLALLFALHAEPARLRVLLAAPTGKAAARLRQSIDASLQELNLRLGDTLDLASFTRRMGAARTLHSLLGARPDTRQMRFNARHLLDVDILIVDEASMIHLEMMSALLLAMPPGAKIILLGDKDQLASVEAGAVLGELCQHALHGHYHAETARYVKNIARVNLPPAFLTNTKLATPLAQQTVMLRESRRFGGLIGHLASAVNDGHSKQALQLISEDTTGTLHASPHPTVQSILNLAVHGRSGASACYANYLELVRARPATTSGHEDWVKSVLIAFDRFRILCAVHAGEWGTQGLNAAIAQALTSAGLLKRGGEWYSGRPVMVTRNDPELGVFNGDVGIALPGTQGLNTLRVYFLDGDSLRSVGVSRLAYVETAFAMTVHKSQGSEFLHTALVLPPGGTQVLARELVYTGITRARAHFTLFEGQPGLLKQAIEQPASRASGLGGQLK